MSDMTVGNSTETRVDQLYSENNNEVETKKDVTTEEVVAKPAVEEKAEAVAQEEIQKADVTEQAKKEAVEVKQAEKEAPVQKIALPPVKLVKISRNELKKIAPEFVKAHMPSRIKDAKIDKARNAVEIEKSKKFRLYSIENKEATPALIESKKRSDVIAYLNKI